MVLLILDIPAEVHWTDNLLNELDLTSRNAIFGVKVSVRPFLGPLLRWHKCVDLPRCVLGWLVQKNEEAS